MSLDTMKTTLGDRMKQYEAESEKYGCKDMRAPVVIRLDGSSFHTWVKKAGCVKPFDNRMIDCMKLTALDLCNGISSCVMGFVQSDEISLVLRNDKSGDSEPWFGNRMQKLCSTSASMWGCHFNSHAREIFGEDVPFAYCDSRVIYLPNKDEVYNCLLWRQRDCIRNSISGQAQAYFSAKELNKKNSDVMLAMLRESGQDWEFLPTCKKYGSLIHKKTTVGEYNGTTFTRGTFFIDDEFGKLTREIFDGAYDFVKEELKNEPASA